VVVDLQEFLLRMLCARPAAAQEATVPSMIFSSACCTPSPDTSRVYRRVVGLTADLVDLVDIDVAALRPLDIVLGRPGAASGMMFSTSSPT